MGSIFRRANPPGRKFSYEFDVDGNLNPEDEDMLNAAGRYVREKALPLLPRQTPPYMETEQDHLAVKLDNDRVFHAHHGFRRAVLTEVAGLAREHNRQNRSARALQHLINDCGRDVEHARKKISRDICRSMRQLGCTPVETVQDGKSIILLTPAQPTTPAEATTPERATDDHDLTRSQAAGRQP